MKRGGGGYDPHQYSLGENQTSRADPQHYTRQSEQDRWQLIPEMKRVWGWPKITEFLDTLIVRSRQCGKCYDEAHVK